MNAPVQQVIVDAVVLAAFAWLVWSFGPDSLRRWVRRRRGVKPSYDVALRAQGLAGERDHDANCAYQKHDPKDSLEAEISSRS